VRLQYVKTMVVKTYERITLGIEFMMTRTRGEWQTLDITVASRI